MHRDQTETRRQMTAMLQQAGITLTRAECEAIELADFGLNDFENQGLALLVYVNTDRYCAKELVLLPRQTCPEHRHPPVPRADAVDASPLDPGKMETFRCRSGKVWLYVEGPGSPASIQARLPEGSEACYSVFHEIELNPGDQYTIAPDTLHWFQAGDSGAIVSEFSSTSRDELDIFTDPNIRRVESD